MIDSDFTYEEAKRLEPELSEPADYPKHEVTEDDLIQEEA